jgi:hypothetical protein
MTNIIKISLKTSKELILDLKKNIGKELICFASYYGGGQNQTNEYFVKDYVDVFFADDAENISNMSIIFDALLLEDYPFLCKKIKMTTCWELCKKENLNIILHGMVISPPKKFIIAKIEILGDKYESPIYKGSQFKVDMDNMIVFTSFIDEKILIMQTDQFRIIQIIYDKSQIERIIYESNKKGVKRYALQALID